MVVADRVPRTTGAGKGRPAGMAILDPEVDEVLRAATAPLLLEQHGRRCGRARRRRRPTCGVTCSGGCSPPTSSVWRSPPSSDRSLVSSVSNNPDSAPDHEWTVYAFNLAVIPMFIAVFAVVRALPGDHPAHLEERLRRPREHPARPDDQRVPLRRSSATSPKVVRFHDQSLSVAKIVAMCLVAAGRPCRCAARSPSGCSADRGTPPSR